MPPDTRAIDLLTSIDGSLKRLVVMLAATAPKPTADDRDLDGKYGDPEVKFLPRDWTGGDYKGRHFSECPAELLDMLANTFDYFAEKDEREGAKTAAGKPVAEYKRRDAARARGWAVRVRAGRVQPAAPPNTEPAEWAANGGFASAEEVDDEVPF